VTIWRDFGKVFWGFLGDCSGLLLLSFGCHSWRWLRVSNFTVNIRIVYLASMTQPWPNSSLLDHEVNPKPVLLWCHEFHQILWFLEIIPEGQLLFIPTLIWGTLWEHNGNPKKTIHPNDLMCYKSMNFHLFHIWKPNVPNILHRICDVPTIPQTSDCM
jgi:hypothetical protein